MTLETIATSSIFTGLLSLENRKDINKKGSLFTPPPTLPKKERVEKQSNSICNSYFALVIYS